MHKSRVVYKSAAVAGLGFDKFYESLASGWEAKAENLRARRWKQLKRKRG